MYPKNITDTINEFEEYRKIEKILYLENESEKLELLKEMRSEYATELYQRYGQAYRLYYLVSLLSYLQHLIFHLEETLAKPKN